MHLKYHKIYKNHRYGRLETDMEERLVLAKKGREIWLSLVEKYNIDNTIYVIILPDTSRQYNEPALVYLEAFLKKRGVKKALVLSYDTWVLGMKEKYKEFARIEQCPEDNIKALLQFYCLYEFAQNIVIGSLKEPSGRMGDYLIGKKGLSAEEVFKGIVYSIVD